MKKLNLALPIITSAVLAACGSDEPVVVRGEVIGSAVTVATVPKGSIDAATAASGAIALTGLALCDVKVASVQYTTLGGRNEKTTATTAVMIPSGGAGCTGPRPLMIYAHGTTLDKANNMADVQSNGEASLVMAMYAAQGFIVVAPNYTGYSGSSLPYHPYLNAEAQSTDVIDGLRAAKTVLAGLGGVASAKLFITGYSQGGYVAMATHREIQTKYGNEFTVTASGPMSGPYSLDKFGQTVYSPTGQVNGGANLFTPLLVDSYQNSYGTIYTRASDIYQSPYDNVAPGLLPSSNAAAANLPANLFDLGNGQPFLIKTSYRADYNSNPNNGFRVAGKRNDLLGWKPNAPVALCYGFNDPVVFGFNSVDSVASIRALGGNVTEFNLENAAQIPSTVKAGFDAQKAGISASAGGGANGNNAVLAAYHSPLVPPYCNTLIREFFRNNL
jgi:Prolyl oligopeptidase family